jgi:hypothetical protein
MIYGHSRTFTTYAIYKQQVRQKQFMIEGNKLRKKNLRKNSEKYEIPDILLPA